MSPAPGTAPLQGCTRTPSKPEMLRHSQKVEMLLEGDVELTPASHAIQRTIKKLIMFGKSPVIYSTASNVLPGELQAGQGDNPTVTCTGHPKHLGWPTLKIKLSSNTARSLKAILLFWLKILMETSLKDLYQKRQR